MAVLLRLVLTCTAYVYWVFPGKTPGGCDRNWLSLALGRPGRSRGRAREPAFLLAGVTVLLRLVLTCTAYVYWVFRGKVRGGPH